MSWGRGGYERFFFFGRGGGQKMSKKKKVLTGLLRLKPTRSFDSGTLAYGNNGSRGIRKNRQTGVNEHRLIRWPFNPLSVRHAGMMLRRLNVKCSTTLGKQSREASLPRVGKS